jgi:hypothetical protein
MNVNHKTLINNIAKETEILESLEWDYEKLDELYQYLDMQFSGDNVILPDVLLLEIENNFGKECAVVLRIMFTDISMAYGLFIHDPDIEN